MKKPKVKNKNLTKPGLPCLPDFPIDDDEIIVIKSKDMSWFPLFKPVGKKDTYGTFKRK